LPNVATHSSLGEYIDFSAQEILKFDFDRCEVEQMTPLFEIDEEINVTRSIGIASGE
jgi:hypothetical protein